MDAREAAWGAALLIVGFLGGRLTARRRPAPPASPPTVLELGDAVRAQVEAEIRSGRTIEAIKTYRAATGQGLKDSKDAVDEMKRRLGAG